MSIDHQLKQAVQALEQSVQDVDVAARLHELPKRQRARSTRAAIAALAIFVVALVPVIAPLRQHPTTSAPAASQTTLRPATGVTVQVLNGAYVAGLANRVADQVRAAGYEVVAANTAFVTPVSTVYYTAGHRADAEAFRERFPAFRAIAPAPSNLARQIALHAVVGKNYTEPARGGCTFLPDPLGC
jgi:hypothetical protein